MPSAEVRDAMRQALDDFRASLGPGGPHVMPDDANFRAGVAYAAHIVRHAIGRAHGVVDDRLVSAIEEKECCQHAVVIFGVGITDALVDLASPDRVPPHTHANPHGGFILVTGGEDD